MASGLNRVYLLGNLGQNPELRATQSGQSVLSMRLATNERFKNSEGEWVDRAEWHSIVVWGKRAEALSKILAKGSPILVEGRIQTRKWEDKEGNTRYTTEIIAREILLLGRKGDGNGPPPHGDEDYGGGAGAGADPGGGDYDDGDIPF
jgi:single-strand DNA-binding protein